MTNDSGTVREGAPGSNSISGDVTCLLVILEVYRKTEGINLAVSPDCDYTGGELRKTE